MFYKHFSSFFLFRFNYYMFSAFYFQVSMVQTVQLTVIASWGLSVYSTSAAVAAPISSTIINRHAENVRIFYYLIII